MLATKLLEAAGNSTQPAYIEDVFSTWLYTGNGSTQTITNGIDLAGKGGLVWFKSRNNAVQSNHLLIDTARTPHPTSGGVASLLRTNLTDAASSGAVNLSWKNDGFDINLATAENWASWTFRKQPKFFDVQTVSHTFGVDNTIDLSALGTVGCVIIKRIDGANNWYVWHRSLGNAYYGLFLNTTGAPSNFGTAPVQVSGTTVTMTDSSAVGGYFSTGTYVVYAWAHNAGGFGLNGTDNVISCGSGSWSGGSDNVVNLGYEVQWLMYKSTDIAGSNWMMWDTMRGMSYSASEFLRANLSDAAGTYNSPYAIYPTATGFTVPAGLVSTGNYIYIAIRRGPMKVPTDGTTVFSPISSAATTGTVVTTGFPLDLQIQAYRGGPNSNFVDRLRGVSSTSTASGPYLQSASTAAEVSPGSTTQMVDNTSFQITAPFSGASTAYWNFRRAPGFFDEVCYTGTGAATTFAHNLAAVPELMIVKGRTGGFTSWHVYSAASANANDFLRLQTTGAWATDANIFGARPTSTVFSVGASSGTNGSGTTYVAYLFASCPGVSKVGSYTGNGTTQTINCGFTGGARFVLIKRTDSTGDWYVYDTARGMTVLTDPYLLLNSTAAESATLGSVTTVTTGFAVNASVLAAINTNGASYIYLAIA